MSGDHQRNSGTLCSMVAAEREQLSRTRIASEALALIDRDGIGGLSMRKLGAALGVEAMSLYHYVDNKDDLLDAVLAQLYGLIEVPELGDAPTDWERCVRSGLQSLRSVLVEHPAAVALLPSRPARSVEAFGTFIRAYEILHRAGLPPADAYSALHYTVAFVLGHTAETLGSAERSLEVAPPALLADSDVAEFVAAGLAISSDELFDLGLDLVIDGLRARFELP